MFITIPACSEIITIQNNHLWKNRLQNWVADLLCSVQEGDKSIHSLFKIDKVLIWPSLLLHFKKWVGPILIGRVSLIIENVVHPKMGYECYRRFKMALIPFTQLINWTRWRYPHAAHLLSHLPSNMNESSYSSFKPVHS